MISRTFRRVAICSAVAVAFCIVGCRGPALTENGDASAHVHTYSGLWSNDEMYHWHEPLCEDTDEVSEKSEHTYNSDRICSVCGYTSDRIRLLLNPVDGEFHSVLQAEYLAGDYDKIGDYADGRAEKSIPSGVTVSWRVFDAKATKADISVFDLYISGTSSFDEYRLYHIAPKLSGALGEQAYRLYNLSLDCVYYLKLRALSDGGEILAERVGEFRTTAQGPRNLYVPGVTNVRDIGGYRTFDGNRVRQGMMYRCGRLNESDRSDVVVEITDEGKRIMLEDLGVRSEIDLRGNGSSERGGINASVLGDEVNYYLIPMSYSSSLTNQRENIAETFSLLADESNYPFIFHCNIGTDRTGIVAFLCNALLGVCENDLYVDYLFSNFGNIGGGRSASTITQYINFLSGYDGDALNEKAENYLLECGVTREQIGLFKAIMLEN